MFWNIFLSSVALIFGILVGGTLLSRFLSNRS